MILGSSSVGEFEVIKCLNANRSTSEVVILNPMSSRRTGSMIEQSEQSIRYVLQ